MAYGDRDYLQARIEELLRNDQINAYIVEWLEFAVRFLCQQVNFPHLRTTRIETTTKGTDTYTVTFHADGMDQVNGVDYEDTVEKDRHLLEPIAYDPDWRRMYMPKNADSSYIGVPRVFTLHKEADIIVSPIPDKTGKNLITDYQKQPLAMASGSSFPDIPSKYRHYLTWIVLEYGRAYERDSANWYNMSLQAVFRYVNVIRSHMGLSKGRKRLTAKSDLFHRTEL